MADRMTDEQIRWRSPSADGHVIDLCATPNSDATLIDLRDSGSPLEQPVIVQPRSELVERCSIRAFDIVVSVTCLVLFAPVLLLLFAAVRLTSRGPALYRSTRIGRGRSEFGALKVRTMVADADDRLAYIIASDQSKAVEFREAFKLRDDPRITRIGRVLRRTSLDELPQLWNILCGDMSVVGPRPKLPGEAERYGPALDIVLAVRPGLTGRWQISGRNDLPYDERIRLDVEYALTRSLGEDIRIVAETARQVLLLRCAGAC